MVLHLYGAFFRPTGNESALMLLLIHPFTHTHTLMATQTYYKTDNVHMAVYLHLLTCE